MRNISVKAHTSLLELEKYLKTCIDKVICTFGEHCTLSLQAIGVDTLLHMFLSVVQLPQVRMSRLGENEILLTNGDSRDTGNLEAECHDVDIA